MPLVATGNQAASTTGHALPAPIAGPCLFCADGDSETNASDRVRFEAAALPIYQRGHLLPTRGADAGGVA